MAGFEAFVFLFPHKCHIRLDGKRREVESKFRDRGRVDLPVSTSVDGCVRTSLMSF